jgi:hypothetical protein
MHVVIYNWCTRIDFLLPVLFPEAQFIDARPQDDERLLVLARQIKAKHPDQALHFFFQINLSYSKQWLLHPHDTVAALVQLGFTVHNNAVTDIRKKQLQDLILQLGLPSVKLNRHSGDLDSPPDMPVMVKSNYNYGGEFESMINPALAATLGLDCLQGCDIQHFDDYYKTTLAQVDQRLWHDERIVIERYIENKEHRFYRFYCCGQRAILSQIINPATIKKMSPSLPRTNWLIDINQAKDHRYQTLIDGATMLLEKIQLSYGAIDIVMDDLGVAYIIDVNPTPGWGVEQQDDLLAFLRKGLIVVEPEYCANTTDTMV